MLIVRLLLVVLMWQSVSSFSRYVRHCLYGPSRHVSSVGGVEVGMG
ncbi:unnamed protein product [Periconia digitata]|uniref:Uncharacterized protein n=1 Tax=Periconia digitata TaxID=1303443 RepID=A0A9W4U1Y9_9PLEO|nr:unnamed protein product [Periconia digitata]